MTIRTTIFASMVAAGLGLPLAAAAQTADKMPMPDGPLSQAQLISTLKAHGYGDIKLSSQQPSATEPHPELTMPLSVVDDAAARITAVHLGWNGTAAKNGERVNIYLKPEASGSASQAGGLMVYLDRMALGAK